MSKEKYVDFLYKGYNYSSEQFDKAILYVSSGTLGLSITMIDKIVPLTTCSCRVLLLLSWLLEAATILFFTVNHLVSVRAFSEEINLEKMDEDIEPKSYDVERKNKLNQIVKNLNHLSIWALILGILFLVIFIFINI